MKCWLRPPLTRHDCFDDALPGRSNNMTPRIPEEFSTRLIDWGPIVIMGNTMPPRDPDEDDEDEDQEEEDRTDEPPVVREEEFPCLRISVLRGHDDQFEAPRLSGGLHCALKVRERKHVRPHRRVPHRTRPMFGAATLRQRWLFGNYGELDCLVVIGDTLAIERRGGRLPPRAAVAR